jgi:polyphenol oxidase
MKIIRPNIFSRSSSIDAIFTESNREKTNQNGVIPGLNLGYNTLAESEEVDSNFRKLTDYLGWDASLFAIAEQVHGNHIEIVTSPGVYKNCDGLITSQPGLAIGIRVADCAAVLMADEREEIAGAFHAGWKGAVAGILPKGIELMQKEGAKHNQIKAFVSPCIQQKNFEVGEEVAGLFPDPFVDRSNYKKPHVDLQGFIEFQLMQSGIESKNIQISKECTMQISRYYSFRRERERAGRMLGTVKITQ